MQASPRPPFTSSHIPNSTSSPYPPMQTSNSLCSAGPRTSPSPISISSTSLIHIQTTVEGGGTLAGPCQVVLPDTYKPPSTNGNIKGSLQLKFHLLCLVPKLATRLCHSHCHNALECHSGIIS